MGRAAEGTLRKLPSGRWQARFQFPDGSRRPAPGTFLTKRDAQAWLAQQQADVTRGEWRPEGTTPTVQLFSDYAARWVASRTVRGRPIAVRTRRGYDDLLRLYINPVLGSTPVHLITKVQVNRWYASMDANRATTRARAYSLLRSILATATDDDELLVKNPCHRRGASHVERRHEVRLLTPAEIRALAEALPPRYRLMVGLAALCNLRFGEVTELRRDDFDLKDGVVRIRRAVVYAGGEFIVKEPKSRAGRRDIHIPPHLLGDVKAHLLAHCAPGADGLLFPSAGDPTRHLHATTLAKVWKPATEAAGVAGLHFHDLRHNAATMTAQVGGTERETMARTGHSSRAAHLIYQHAAAERDREIAQRLSDLMTGTG